jgi:hypothetical protein
VAVGHFPEGTLHINQPVPAGLVGINPVEFTALRDLLFQGSVKVSLAGLGGHRDDAGPPMFPVQVFEVFNDPQGWRAPYRREGGQKIEEFFHG